MSTPQNQASPAPPQYPYPVSYAGQQQPGSYQNNGGPGPSTVMQQQQQPNGNGRQQLPQGVNPQQMAVLQQMAATRGPNGQAQFTPQQMQMIMAQMQTPGVNSQQAMMQAMQAGPGQMLQQRPQMSPAQGGMMMPGQHQPGGSGQPNQGGQGGAGGPVNQQRMMQMLNQQQQAAGSPQRNGSHDGNQPRQTQPNPGMMPPPPIPQNIPGAPQSQPASFSLSGAQQQAIANQRAQLLSNPQFCAMTPQQQQHHMTIMQQKMAMMFAQQNAQGQQQQQQIRSESVQGSNNGQSQQSPQQHRQPLPGQPHPMSSLPQHMAPPRSASAASQRAPSPHNAGSPSMRVSSGGTPPPPIQQQQQYIAQTPVSAPSPAMSNHSQHSQHMTPQQHQQSLNSASPISLHAATPNGLQPVMPMTPQAQTIGLSGQHQSWQNQHTQAQAMSQSGLQAMQQHAQSAQSMLHSGQLGTPGQPGQPGFAIQPNQEMGMPHKPQGMYGGHQNQQGVRPNQAAPQNFRPPVPPELNTNDFPFDPRLLTQLPHMNDSRWRAETQQRNPKLFAAMQSALQLIQSRTIPPETWQRMQQFLNLTNRISQAQGPGRPPGNNQITNPQMGGQIPGQHRYPGGQQGVPGVRPPPPHLPPTSMPESPMNAIPDLARRTSAGKDRLRRERTPSQAAMPPPAWIPMHNGALPPRSSSLNAMDAVANATAEDIKPVVPPASSVPVKEWESYLRLNLPITNITQLPDTELEDPTFSGQLPDMSDEEKRQVKSWIEADEAYVKALPAHKEKVRAKMMKWARNNDMETPWWSLRKGEPAVVPRGRLKIVWPEDKLQQRGRTSHRNRSQIRFSQKQLKAMANVEEHLVPVRLDLEHDHWRLKDTFMWNCADTVVTPELFAQSLCDDFAVPTHHFIPKVVAVINERIHEYRNQVLPFQPRASSSSSYTGRGTMDSSDKSVLEVFRRAREGSEEIKTESGHEEDDHVTIVNGDDDERAMTVEEIMGDLKEDTKEELRILIKVDIIVGTQNLSDAFEWDLDSVVSPEDFAASYVKELGLSGEYITALAHDIHEQILVHKRSLFLVGHAPGSGLILDDEVRSAFLPPVPESAVLRREDIAMSSFTPIFANFTEEDIAAIEKERERDGKRKKRATRARRGIVLPDREPIKTHRSLVNPIGPNGLVAIVKDEASAPAATTSRRAAAIAAQANINLLAQDLPLPQPPSPVPIPAPRPRGRIPKSGRRASPTSTEALTPSTSGKRHFREDSMSEINSPIPRKRAYNRIVETPELDNLDTNVKIESLDVKRKFEDDPVRLNVRRTKSKSVTPALPLESQDTTPTESRSAKDEAFSPSNDSDSEDSVDSPKPPTIPISKPPPVKAITPVPPPPKKAQESAPAWTFGVLDAMRRDYPLDNFSIVPKPRPAGQTDGPIEWRVKCIDCPGKVYSLGPGETLQNFEVHLKHKLHLGNRHNRERGGGKS